MNKDGDGIAFGEAHPGALGEMIVIPAKSAPVETGGGNPGQEDQWRRFPWWRNLKKAAGTALTLFS